MKKLILSKVCALFSAGILLSTTMLPKISTATEETGTSTTVSCPEGDIYKCYIVGGDASKVVYKGKGETIITQTLE